jgi:hypothetical protein
MLRRQNQSQSPAEVELLSSAQLETSSLAAQLRYLGLVEGKVGNYGSRPIKRRKLSPGQEVLSEVVKEVYLLLGSQHASDLDGLEQIAPYVHLQFPS